MLAHFLVQAARDLVDVHLPARAPGAAASPDGTRLDAATAYLLRTIDACGGVASSKGYRIAKGWMPPYPETSGYIVPTLYDLAAHKHDPSFRTRAEAIGGWLLSIQLDNGGFVGRELGKLDKPIVFNTGQILLGLNRLILETGREEYQAAAVRAGDFLISCQDETGCFVRNLSNDILHTYNSRSAWALMQLGRLVGEKRFVAAARGNATWCLEQQLANGFFRNNTFKPGGNVNLHGIAYVLSGLVEMHELGGDRRLLEAAVRTSDRLLALYGSRRWIAAEIGEDWRYLSSHICLTGYAQMAIIYLQLYGRLGDRRHLNAALNLIDDVARTQDVRSRDAPHFGGIKGSHPIYGRYAPLQYPNWATKFYIDALLLKHKVRASHADRVPVQLPPGRQQGLEAGPRPAPARQA